MIRSIETPGRRRRSGEAHGRDWARWRELLVGLLLVCVVGGSYWAKTRSTVPAQETVTETSLMNAGLEALHARMDPDVASTLFREVLRRNPSHYGATYQLAMALDRAGRPDEARPHWQRILSMAESAQDADTAATARKRLESHPLVREEATQAALMKAGLDALYTRGDAEAAAAEFRKVLARNPTHYGAVYQLATALDRSGRAADARPLWEQVVKMAERYDDKEVMATARARLARTP